MYWRWEERAAGEGEASLTSLLVLEEGWLLIEFPTPSTSSHSNGEQLWVEQLYPGKFTQGADFLI